MSTRGSLRVVVRSGRLQAVYDDRLLGVLERASSSTWNIRRASHVEPDDDGRWMADMAPVGGPVLGPYVRRSDALEAETAWLRTERGL